MEKDNPYEILGIAHDEDDDGIRKAYRRMALICHPDKIGEGKNITEMQAQMARVNEAYAILGDPQQKREYDSRSTVSCLRSIRSPNVPGKEPFPAYFSSHSKTAKYFSSRHLKPTKMPEQLHHFRNKDGLQQSCQEPVKIYKHSNGTTRVVKKITRYENGKSHTYREIATIHPDGTTQFRREGSTNNSTNDRSRNYMHGVLFCVSGALDTVQECIS